MCTIVLHMCTDLEYTRQTVQFYYDRILKMLKPETLSDNNFADVYYEDNIRGVEDTLINYKILHLSDLAIDLDYVAGSDASCREFRCCHADS